MIRDIGILGLGLWDGQRVGNDFFGEEYVNQASVKDPYKGMSGEDGTVRIAGVEFSPERHGRTINSIRMSFTDPHRGTRWRRFFPPDLKVSDAETEAARKAIADAGMTPRDIDAVLVQSFLPDEVQPKNEAIVAHNLGIRHAPAWGVDSGCNSSLSQLTVAASLIHSGVAKTVVCVQSVTYSRVRDPGALSCILEADMATAMVLGPQPGAELAFSWRTDGRLHAAIRLQWDAVTGSPRRRWGERSAEQLLIRFDPELQAQVMSETVERSLEVCHEALRRADTRLEDIGLFVTHQPMSWYTPFMEDVLGLRDGVAVDTFTEYANISSSSIPASLHHARQAGRVAPGTRVLAFSPGAGYTYGAVALRWGGR